MRSFTNTTTSREAFDAIRTEYASIQTRLNDRMAARAAAFGRQSSPGFDLLGDEEMVLRYLAIALAAAGDRSAIDELEIEY